MHDFSVVCFLTVSFCLMVCVSANTDVTVQAAQAAVDDAQNTVNTVRDNAQKQLDNANLLLTKVESSKDKATQAILQAEEAAKDTPKANEIVKKVKEFAQAVTTSYPEANEKLVKAVESLASLLKEAQNLEKQSNIEIKPNDGQENNFSETNEKATALKSEATVLNGNITEEVKLFEGIEVKANEMEQNAKKAQLAHSHVVAIVAVAQIETMIVKADTIIGDIQSKNNDVNGVLQEIKTQCKNELIETNEILKNKCSTTDEVLNSATGAVEETKNSKGKIEQQKELAEAALTNIEKTDTVVTTAQQEANKANDCVATAQQNIDQLNNALKTVDTSLTTANDAKQEIMTALSEATNQQSSEKHTKTEKSSPPLGNGTESHQNDATKQPAITDTEQPTSKELLDQSNNSANKLKDTLSNRAQNVPTTALTGEKAPTPGAKNDSAMTVSVPLLVALIASAILQ